MVEQKMNPKIRIDESKDEYFQSQLLEKSEANQFDISLLTCNEKSKKMDIGQLLEQGSIFAK